MISWLPALVLALVAMAAAIDWRRREVPHWICLAVLACGVWGAWWQSTSQSWTLLLAGLLVGLIASLPWYLLGGLGGGDVKLLAALGGVAGPAGLGVVLFGTALAGAVLAMVAKLRGQKEFAYVPAIAVGWVTYLLWPGALRDVLLR